MLALLAVLTLRGLVSADTTLFPLVAGATWTYRGTVTTMAGGATRTRRVVQTMRIARVWTVGSALAALIQGHPADLLWADPGAPVRQRLVVRTADLRWYEREVDPRLGPPADSVVLAATRDPDAQFLQWPLAIETRFGPPESLARADGWYAWRVSEIHRESTGRLRYRLELWTNPDTQIADFVPGIGLTRFHYRHHGTPMAVDVRLVARAQR
jgi:hypothetical protein